jgi:VWFA-related protein
MALRARLTTLLALACSAGASQDAPAFRSDTRLVQINVVVHDKTGPVASLTKDDFVLTDKGKPRAISVFSVESSAQSNNAGSAGAALPANTFSNRPHAGSGSPGGVTIILLDRLNTLDAAGSNPYENNVAWFEDHALGFAKKQLIDFVKEMNPNDRVAVYSLAQSLTVLCDFTGDRDQLLKILTAYRATSITSREKAEPGETHTPAPGDFNQRVDQERRTLAAMVNAERTRTTMAALFAIARHVADIPGRKNLVWLTANLPFSGVEAGRALARANLAIYPIDARGLIPHASAPGTTDDIHAVPGLQSSLGAGISAPSKLPGIDTMEQLADETGGRAFFNTNDLKGAIRKAVDDAEVTYTLGFYPDPNSLDDKFHELKVRVKRSGSEVRAPRGYFALKETAVSDAQHQSTAMEAVLSPLESSAIHVDATLERGKDSLAVAGSIDLHDLQLSEAPTVEVTGAVQVSIVQQDAAGRILDQTRNRYNIAFTKESYAAHLKSGVVFRQNLIPKEGLATLRIVISDLSDARVGSLIIPYSQVK